jgi:hypothetical protein
MQICQIRYDLQNRHYSMFKRVHVFGQICADFFPAGSLERQLLDRIPAGLDELRDLMPKQTPDRHDAELQTEEKGACAEILA